MTWLSAGLALVVAAWPAAFAVQAVLVGRRGGLRDRAGAVASLANALLSVVLLRAMLPWQVVPPLLWGLPVAATALGALAAAGSWRRLPTASGDRPRLRLAGAGASVVVSAALLVLLLLGPALLG